MDSSADEYSNFAWANASSHSSDSMDSTEDNNEIKDLKNYKYSEGVIKKEKRRENSCTNENKSKKRKHKTDTSDSDTLNESPVKKRIKVEPNSDSDNMKKKHKKRHSNKINGGLEKCSEYIQYDEDYLDIKVKEELNSTETPSHTKTKKKKKQHKEEESIDEDGLDIDFMVNKPPEANHEEVKTKSKKKKRHSEVDYSIEYEEQNNEPVHNEMETTSPRKKKKEKKKATEYESNEELVIEDKFTAEDTILQKQDSSICYAPDISKKNPHQKSSVENIELQNHESDNDDKPKSTPLKASLKVKTKNTPSILDRIRFEDDIDSDIEKYENKNKPFSTKFNNFIRKNVSLKPISDNNGQNMLFTQDDEIWVLKCPHEVNIQSLINKDLNIDNKTKIKINGETYNGSLEESVGKVTIVAAGDDKFTLKNLDINGIISFKKRLPKPHFVQDTVMVNNLTDFIPLPETKYRHPLFGSDYKKAIKIPISLSQRLTQNHNIESGTHERKKKKKHKKEYDREKEIEAIIRTKMEIDSDVPVKKAKKRKHSEWNDEPAKKTKKIKHEPDSSEVWESEKAIEENLFNF